MSPTNSIRFGNCEIFFVPLAEQTPNSCFWHPDDDKPVGEGWFYWSCQPGCLPEGDPIGPFANQSEAYLDACKNCYIADEDEDGGVE